MDLREERQERNGGRGETGFSRRDGVGGKHGQVGPEDQIPSMGCPIKWKNS
ncbi:MAG: hypothetical protein P1U35_06475 [Cycloclasticus sp.]|nr:hypothetical protein [Cycloclasticus sp.]